MENIIEWVRTNWNDILAIYGGVVAICTVIVKFTPNTKDDTILAKIIAILDYFSTAFSKKDREKLNNE